MGRLAAAGAPGRVTVSVVVVNWNAGSALDGCVERLVTEAPAGHEVLLVDNASSDGSTQRVAARFPEMRVLDVGANVGFAAGANLGARDAGGDVLVFVNPDARVEPGAVTALVDALLAAPGAGIAGGGLRDARGRWRPAAARFAPVAHLLLDTTLGRLRARARRAPYTVDWVYGTFMAVRRDVFRRLGGFDARYFVYGEDMDLCYRAARLGVDTVHVPGARAEHGANVSAAQRFGSGREAEVVKGEMRFYAARLGRWALCRYRVVAALKFGLRAVRGGSTGATYARVVRACLAFDPRRDDGAGG